MLGHVGRYVTTHPFTRCLLIAGVLSHIQYSAPGAIVPGACLPRSGATLHGVVQRGAAVAPQTANVNPGLAPPHSTPHGRTYGEWTALWWQWALGIPGDRNPVADVTGEFCGEGQAGPVWFLAGTFGNSAERSCAIPTGKAIFMPVFNWIFGAGVFDCDPTVPGVPCDVAALVAAAAANTEAAEILDVSIDGVQVRNVRDYRASSPGPFSITYPENSVVGVPAGTYYPQVADGYWLMLTPFSKGRHDIRVHVIAPGTIFGLLDFVVVHHLTVQ